MSGLPEELLEGAVFERRGAFTLAADKAREKMRRFQLENPRRYLLQVIAALVASGAVGIDVTTEDADLLHYGLQVDFDGPGYTAEELAGLYDAVFLPGYEPAQDRLRELAMGVLSCQGLPAKRIEIRSGGAVWLWEGGETTLRSAGGPPGHRIAIVGPGSPDEARLLQEACQAVPVPLRLNGQRVNTPHRRWSAAVPWPAHAFRLPDAEGVVGLPYRDLAASRIAFYRYGVQFAARKLPELRPPVSLAVEAARLRRNVSHTDVVEDEAWRDLVAGLPGVVTDLAVALAAHEAPAYHREEVRSFLLAATVEWLPPELVAQPDETWPPELRPLAKARLFADRRGHRLSLDDLLPHARREGFVCTTTRRLPYAPLGDWLLLNPSEDERAVLQRYFRLVDVDAALPEILRKGGRQPVVEPPPLAAEPLARVQHDRALLIVDDRVPDGRCRLRQHDGDRVHYEEFAMHGWSVDVQLHGEAPLQQANAVLQEGAEHLFRRLLRRLPSGGGPRRARAREHLMAWWRSRLDPVLGPVPPEDPAERAALGRRCLGDEAWTAGVFDTRAGEGVSLADIAAWIAQEGALAVAVGGPRRPGDHALDGSPAQLAFLSRVFGTEAVVRATLRAVVQGGLAEAADRVPSEAAAPAPVEAATSAPVVAASEPVVAASEPVVAASAPVVAASAPAPADPEPPAELEASAPSPEVLEWQAWRDALPGRPALAGHAFQEGPLSGYLAVMADPDDVVALRGDSPHSLGTLFGRSVVGWVQAPVAEDSGWTREEEAILRGQLELLYDRLAERMSDLPPSSEDFSVGRVRLIEHLLASPSRVRERLEADSPQDPLIRLRFLPVVGEGLASLADLWPEVERLGYLPVITEMWPEAAGDGPIALTGARVPKAFYERIFLKTGGVADSPAESPPFRLLHAAVRELRQARARGDYRLSEEVLDRIEWSETGPEPVRHDPRTGRTLVFQAHRALRGLTTRFQEDPAVAGLLASAIFSAVNRALEDVGDEDELRFLEALLDVVDG